MRSLLLERLNEKTGPAITDERGTHDYASVARGAADIAAHLLGRDKASLEGERVAMLVPPGYEFVATLFGILAAGGTAIVLSPLHPAAESAYFCADARVRTILVTRELEAKLGEAADGRDLLEPHALLARPAPRPASPPLPEVRASDDALQLYTSGTTGRPKGAVLTHENLGTQQALVGEAWHFSPSDTLLHALPLHHMHGLAIALLTALGAGAHVRMLPSFEASRVWDEMAKATVFMGVPTMYTRLLDAFEVADDDRRAAWERAARALRLATSGSAALPVPLAARWEAVAGCIPVERFGMTEIGVGMTNPASGPRERRRGTVGWPLPTVETRVVADDGADAETGELLVRGPSVFRGYFEREDATREAFVAATDGGRPWFRTGDTVTRDADGAFRILGRTSVDILKSGGYKLSALEIEEVLLTHPAVREVAVVGVPDEAWGERVVACVVAHDGRASECTTEAVRAFAREKIASYKCPREVRVMKALPRNAMGKVVKPALVKDLLGGT